MKKRSPSISRPFSNTNGNSESELRPTPSDHRSACSSSECSGLQEQGPFSKPGTGTLSQLRFRKLYVGQPAACSMQRRSHPPGTDFGPRTRYDAPLSRRPRDQGLLERDVIPLFPSKLAAATGLRSLGT